MPNDTQTITLNAYQLIVAEKMTLEPGDKVLCSHGMVFRLCDGIVQQDEIKIVSSNSLMSISETQPMSNHEVEEKVLEVLRKAPRTTREVNDILDFHHAADRQVVSQAILRLVTQARAYKDVSLSAHRPRYGAV
jgi:hypothetical protein